ncbi:energy transducer TonB [Flagellimonas lutaonensis]|uniref:TonB n=1 Tax=Flagellimonas lutaonensis TaxID=516051 RepID=A0A0D5YUC3_9FLAO|nr:energy transducer TonB [Allomuricauda lutaonensis]AKA35458.1 TonB [Allomuricauda lutaonensis]
MRSKKNPQVDLSRNSSLYFMVGLTVALFTIWQLLEYKTYETEDEFVQVLEVAEDIKEEVPVTQQIRTAPPPPPPAAPAVIEVVEDELEIEETIIESTESSQETEVAEAVVSVDDVEVGEEEEEVSVPFAIIENAPIFPGCENLSTEAERRECFNRKVQEHIKKNFTYPKTALELGIQGRVFVKFDIDSQGRVANIQKRGPDRLLEEEAARIISALPKVKPGQQRGRPTKVAYSIPINFVMQ